MPAQSAAHEASVTVPELLSQLGPQGCAVLFAVAALVLLKLIGEKGRRALRRAALNALRKLGRRLARFVAVAVWAAYMRMPIRLAYRLQPERWREMCQDRKLIGLKRGKIRRTAYGLSILVRLNGAMDLTTLNNRVAQLETGLGVKRKSVRIEPNEYANRATLHVLLRDPLRKPTPWPGHPSGDVCEPVVIGLTPHGQQIVMSLRQRIAIAGTAGSGKSVFARLICAAVVQCANARLTYIDLKKVEAQNWRHVATTATTPEEARAVVAALRARLDQRLEALAARGVVDHHPTPAEPDEVILVDEGAELVRAGMPDVIEQLTSIAQMGRAAGFHLVWCTQYPTAQGLPVGIGTQANALVALRVESKRVSDVVLGQGMAKEGWRADRLKGKGWFLVKDLDHDEPDPARAMFMDEAGVRALRRPDDAKDAAAPVSLAKPEPKADEHQADDEHQDQAPAAEPQPEGETAPEAIRRVLADAPAEGLSVAQLKEATGFQKTALYAALTELRTAGTVVQPKHGRFALVVAA